MRRKQQARTAATVHISFWIDGPPGLPLKQTATFRCEEDALRFLQQRKYTGRQHGERRMSASTPEPPTPGQYSSDLAVDTPARSAARAAAAALAAVAAPLVRDLLRKRRRSLRRARRRRRLRKRVADAAAKGTSESTEEELEGAAVAATLAAVPGEDASEGAAAAATPAADSERKVPEGAATAVTPATGLGAATAATAMPLLRRLAAAPAALGGDPQAGTGVWDATTAGAPCAIAAGGKPTLDASSHGDLCESVCVRGRGGLAGRCCGDRGASCAVTAGCRFCGGRL